MKAKHDFDVIVIGGGASGMMAAGRSAEMGKSHVPAPVDLDPDQLVRRPGHDAGPAAHCGGAAAREPDSDGLADVDGDPALRAVFAAGRRLARPGAQAADLHRRRKRPRLGSRRCSTRVVAWLAVDAVDVRERLSDRHHLHDRRHSRADRADASGGARAARRGACEECARQFGAPRSQGLALRAR